MAILAAEALRNGALEQMETVGGTAPILRIYSGSAPATILTAASGLLLAQGTLPSDWLAAAASGAKALLGTWTLIGQGDAGGGTQAGYYRIVNSGDSLTLFQGLAGGTVQIPTTALTAAMGNVLTFSSTTGVLVGMRVSGSGIIADSFVVAVSGTTATISRTSTAGVSNGASITFNYDLTLDNASIAQGQTVTVQSWNLSIGG